MMLPQRMHRHKHAHSMGEYVSLSCSLPRILPCAVRMHCSHEGLRAVSLSFQLYN
jgi:hypothetical protein